ncbi:O-antigen ligase family protein [Simiduia sp. 21SJ11W-1]|uniref:O-antigen ligase family protein n=1 Tax=Simiduia sp. 21SJ11W-1 TaxID=2909669 RepID=UPI0020A1971C|nr:O-antigen ligase family protein [Simiduia sp. 21SJ11W-1]UTA48007.1 O-antigen ligase family protein [Simiduia sp. 21SJ11W-1]
MIGAKHFTGIAGYLPENRFLTGHPLLAGWLLGLAILGAFLEINFGESADDLRDVFLLSILPAMYFAPKPLWRSAPMLFLMAACLIALLCWGVGHWLHPEIAERSPKVNRLTNWLLAIPFALAMGGHLRAIFWVWGAAVLALLLSPWLSGGGLAEISRGLNGFRIDFALHNAQHTALYFGVALLGMFAFMPRVIASGAPKAVMFVIWLLVTAFIMVAVLITQTRGVWLGLLVGFVTLGGLMGLDLARRRAPASARRWILLAAGMLVALFASQSGVVVDRLKAEADVLGKVVQGQPIEDATTSSGIRLRSWAAAVPWIKERPIVGWGGQGRKAVIEKTDQLPQRIKDITRHLHSSYMDTLVNFGLLGFTLLLSLWGWLLYGAKSACKDGRIPRDLFNFFVAFMAYFAVVNLFESYMYYSSGVLVFALICGGVISCIWCPKQTQVTQSPGP